ncbi:MAG: U32 family peptidase [Desulfobulbaceae bacterium]|nr:U32 family peptidase [Desulfobulbaceae bacterium]
MENKRALPELLAPAGSFDKLVTAIHYGADAVYLGGKQYSLRSRAANFDQAGLQEAVEYAHKYRVKVYVTLNIFATHADFDGLEDYFLFLRHAGVDGVIISDPGILYVARKIIPEVEIHLSTQANVTNPASVCFWGEQGVKRVNLARELSLAEISTIRQSTSVELEVFVHGALCISYSGRCMLSTYLTGRDANRGDCAQPCRYSYRVVEEKRPDRYFPVEEDERGTYIFNSKDLCLLNRLPTLIGAGVDSLKIEGRVKSMGYVGQTVRVYRAALDWIRDNVSRGTSLENCVLPVEFSEEMKKIGTRGQSENFADSSPDSSDMLYDEMRAPQPWAPVGIVRSASPLTMETRNLLRVGDEVEYLPRSIATQKVRITSITNAKGESIERANPSTLVEIASEPPINDPEVNGIVRIIRK